MEAAATPLPKEETTPPVTKIYFGAIRKALDFLRENERTHHYGQKSTTCQIAFLILIFDYARDYAALACSRSNFSTRSMSAGTSTLTAS
jgi:hypothetical protein